MMDGYPETAGTVSTSTYSAEDYQTFEATDSVEMDCLCCSTDRFEHFETVRKEHGVVGRFRCVGCGAVSDHRISREQRGETL